MKSTIKFNPVTTFPLCKKTARHLLGTKSSRWMYRFDSLKWDIEGLETALRRDPEDGFLEHLLEESIAERAALERHLGLDKNVEPDWDSIEEVEIDGVLCYIEK